jgi:hypothetical protein
VFGPWLMDRGSGRFTVHQEHGHGGELARAPALGRFWPWGPDVRWGKGRGCYRGLVLPITKAWETAMVRVQWRVGGGELGVWGASLGSSLLSYPGLRKWNRSLYTCAQDVQFTGTVTI